LAACSGSVIGRIIIMDIFKENATKAFTTIYPIIGTSPAIAPLIGGELVHLSSTWISTFVALFVIGLFAAILTARHLHSTSEPLQKFSLKRTILQYKLIARNKKFWGYAAMFIGQYQAWFIYIMITPFLFHNAGLSAREIGYLYIPLAAIFFLSNKIVKKLINTRSAESFLFAGILLIGAGSILFLIPIHLSHWLFAIRIIIPMLFVMAGCAVLATLGTVGALSTISAESKIQASALLGFTQLSLGALTTFILAHLFHTKLVIMGASITCLFILLLIIYCSAIRKDSQCS